MADVILPESSFANGNSANDILQRMLDNVPSTYDKTEGQPVYDQLASTALEIEGLYLTLDQVVNQSFIQSATDVYLDALAQDAGLLRKAGAYASVSLTFTLTGGATNVTIPANTRVSNVIPTGASGTPIVFQTISDLTISSGSASTDAQCVDPGVLGNVGANALTRMEAGIAAVAGVTNASAATGGADPETDDALRARALTRAQQGRGAGTVGDYEGVAENIIGIGHAFIEPLWNGNGTVRVIVVDDTFSPVGATALSAAQAAIAAFAPIGVTATVVTPSTTNINVSCTLTLDVGYTLSSVTPSIQLAIQTYLKAIQPGGTVYLTELAAVVIQSPGVLDYAAFQIGAPSLGTTNVLLGSNQKPVLGTLTLS